ncbi:MAG: oxygen-independent coproporphyrinogen III oxidase, partial [Proteobacteria bacterium]|nr:oxygen-independent coproporphyrinogen III oxidase [Pseudomonadota bacterium]
MDPRYRPYVQQTAPRYTSYPSAPHFSSDVDRTLYEAWLHALPAEQPLSIYLHIPYCRAICWYCGCNTYAARREDTLSSFIDSLLREIDLVAEATPASKVVDIHWGGGTPNILSAAQFTRISHHLAFWFDVHDGASQTVEIDPRMLTGEQAEAYAAAGVTRASLGVQDLNEHVQRAIGRVQPAATVAQAMRTLRAAGIGHISMDLMYGLPNQTNEDLVHTLRTAAEMRPQRIALFGYAHVPWFKKRQRLIDAARLPGPEARFDQAEAARLELAALGYTTVGLDHYCLPGDDLLAAAERGNLHRNFQGYVANSTGVILGFGPSAISTLPQGYAQNMHEPGAWAKAIENEKLPIARGHRLSADDCARRDIIERLMCELTADLTPLGGARACARELGALAALADNGLVVVDG